MPKPQEKSNKPKDKGKQFHSIIDSVRLEGVLLEDAILEKTKLDDSSYRPFVIVSVKAHYEKALKSFEVNTGDLAKMLSAANEIAVVENKAHKKPKSLKDKIALLKGSDPLSSRRGSIKVPASIKVGYEAAVEGYE